MTPGPINILIGANATGKSNFIDCLGFISEIYRNGLERAISEKGGYYNICFRRHRRTKSGIRISLQYELKHRSESHYLVENLFEINAAGEGISADFIVKSETLRVAKIDGLKGYETRFSVNRKADSKALEIKIGTNIEEKEEMLWDYIKDFAKNIPLVPDELVSPTLIDRIRSVISIQKQGARNISKLSGLEQMRTHHFLVPVCAQASSASPAPQLGFQGEFLASTIDFLQKKESTRQIFERVIEKLQTAVPEIKEVKSRYTDEKKLGLIFYEKTDKWDIPWKAHEVSDGTITALALFVALFDIRSTVIAIDEPENALHPWIAKAFVEVCHEVSREKQIFLTTQSQEIVDVSSDEVFTVEKNSGVTSIKKVSDSYPEFHDEPVGDIWISGMIGAVPQQMELDL